MMDYIIFVADSFQKHQGGSAIIYFGLATLLLRYVAPCRAVSNSLFFVRSAIALSVIVVGVYFAIIVCYLNFPNFVDHAEVTVATISWLGLHGHPFYPDWTTGNIYGLLYGPNLYLVDGLALLMSPTLVASKLPGVFSLIAALCIFFAVIRIKTESNWSAFIAVASAITLMAPFEKAFSNRSEPFLICISTLALFAVISLRPLQAAVVVGALAGIATDFKIHGVLYIVPTALMLFAETKNARERFGVAIAGFVCGAILAFLPFFLKQSSLYEYSRYLRAAADHGISLDWVEANFRYALALVTPAMAIWFWYRPSISSRDRWAFAGLITSIAITVIIAGKPGSGSHHLLPFIPLCLYAAINVGDLRGAAANGLSAIIFILLLLAYYPSYIQDIRYAHHLFVNSQIEREKGSELEILSKLYPHAQIGVSGNERYSDSYLRFILVLKGSDVRLDFNAWMDLAYGGVSERYVRRLFERCEVPTWILPLGSPFTLSSYYTGAQLFSEDLRNVFLTSYKLVRQGMVYQVWQCVASANEEKN